MALFSVNSKPASFTPPQSDNIAEKIKRRRYQILVHSLLYYELDVNLISDKQWSEWAAELVKLQEQYPEVSKSVIFADEFKLFDGSTGFNLPYRDEQIVNIAYRQLKIAQSKGDASVEDALLSICRVRTTPAHYSGFSSNSKSRTTNTNRKAVKKSEPIRKKLF